MYKPRHMRLRKAQCVALTVATGAAVAAPVIAASSAHAATVAQWDRIAQCESSGRWNLPYGDDGSTGGLQIQDATWRDFGGTAYAPHAYQTSKATQIAVAERILKVQGSQAWTCAKKVGIFLTPGGNNEVAQSPQPNPPPQPPAPTKPLPLPPMVPDPQQAGHHKVMPGDTLFSIAAEHHVKIGALFHANLDIIRDPNLIDVGQVLVVPTGPVRGDLPAPSVSVTRADGSMVVDVPSGSPAPLGIVSHTVEAGDTLQRIATDHRTTVAALIGLNSLSGPTDITPGDILLIPGNSGAVENGPAPAPPSVQPSGKTVVVGHWPGQNSSLWEIAVSQLGNGSRWHEIFNANRNVIHNPNSLTPGQVLRLP